MNFNPEVKKIDAEITSLWDLTIIDPKILNDYKTRIQELMENSIKILWIELESINSFNR